MEDIKQKITDLIVDGVDATTVEEHHDVANDLHDIANGLWTLRKCTLTIPKGVKQEYAEAMEFAFDDMLSKIAKLSDLCSDKEDYFCGCAVEVEDA